MKKYLDIFFSFCRVGGLTFGGGLAMLPILEREVNDSHGWLTKEEIADSLLALRDIHDKYGHIQEIIIQNFTPIPGIEMENSQIIKIVDIKLARLFRNILWKCELYNNYKIGEHKLGLSNFNIKTATISTIVDNFSEEYFLVIKDYNPDPPKKYYVIKQEKRYDEFINSNFRENGELFKNLKNEIYVLWKRFGKKVA